MRRSRLVLTVLALVAVGCGNTRPADAPKATVSATAAATITPTATPTVTHTEFVRSLDATCKASSGTLKQQFDAAGDDTAKLAGLVHQFRDITDAVIAQQRKLQAPPADRAAFRRYLKAQQRMSGTYARMEAALVAGDVEQTRYLISARDELRSTRTRAALDLGLRRCGA